MRPRTGQPLPSEAAPDAGVGAVASGLERYLRELPDGAELARALGRPPPPCVLAHAGRVARDELATLLSEQGLDPEPVGWHPHALRLPHGSRPGLAWPFRAGLCHVLEEASLLPVALLAPRPGDRVLDLCAAPGGKTAQIATRLGLRGTLVANDRSAPRLAALRGLAKRWGLLNVTATCCDGRHLPLSAGPFDRVLVDAPCSAEGTRRRPSAAFEAADRGFRHRVVATQKALLRRALALCAPGGRVVYSTCSLAPEEDEAVVDAVLREHPTWQPVDAAPEGLPGSPGLERWGDAAFDARLTRAVRLWPHRGRTGGFFAVALERAAGDAEDRSDPPEAALDPVPDDEAAGLFEDLARRFALPPGALAGLRLVRKGARSLHAVADDHAPPAAPAPVFHGVPFARVEAVRAKPTTAAALLLGRHARRNVLEVDAEQAEATLSRRPFRPRPGQLADCDGRGFVLLRHRGLPLGAGLLRPGPDGPEVESQFPRAWVPHAEREEGDGAARANTR